MQIVLPIVQLLLLDAVFVALLALAMFPLIRYKRAAYAVLKRNFASYFSTPTGYVFLCVFVFLTGLAAFWPHEFFNSNMATLDQLNRWLPYIMLIFIPTITMSIWSEERRQGTDELLLTIPADDFDIVLGKYLATAAIFTASLLFSQLSNFAVLNALALGEVDMGLFFVTYLGYWLVGLAMLAIGMVASFLTGNLTVGFILGVIFNAPLVFAGSADVILPSEQMAQEVSRWSLSTQFEDFGRGVVSVSSIIFFVLLICVGFYLSMVLIGRRHWLGGRDGHSMLGHFVVRTVALVVLAVAASVFFTNHDRRFDATSGQVSSLSASARRQIRQMDVQRPVYIEAFISNTLPEPYVQIKFNLISLLREMKAAGGGDVMVNIHDDMEPFSEEAKLAEEQYGIQPMTIATLTHGSYSQEEIFMSAAFTCGLERVVIPFFGPGTPVEYELLRSLRTVADQAGQQAAPRRTLGVLRTDAQVGGGFNMSSFSQIPRQAIIDELEKQYDVEEVDPSTEIDVEQYDVLLAVQPSSLTQPQLDNLIAAVRKGLPTAIFEDPAPVALVSAPGTDAPKRPAGGMMGMSQPPEPKGNISQLWDLLGVRMVRAESASPMQMQATGQPSWNPFTAVIWQDYNPYPKVRQFPSSVLFANPNAPGSDGTFNADQPAVSGLNEVAFLAPGAFEEAESRTSRQRDLKFIPLVTIGEVSGLMSLDQLRNPQSDEIVKPLGAQGEIRLTADGKLLTEDRYVLAARVTEAAEGKGADEGDAKKKAGDNKKNAGDKKSAEDEEAAATTDPGKIDVVLVSDIDVLESMFVRLRNQPGGDIDFNFQNVTFVLNLVDVLAGDTRFVDIRKRQVHHSSLQLIENRIREAEERTREEVEEFEAEINRTRQERMAQRQQVVANIQAELNELKQKGQLDSRAIREAEQKLEWQQRRNEAEEENEQERLKRQLEAKLRQIQRELDLDRLRIQNQYKFWAVVLPPIPPLIVALVVFARRRVREREGVSKKRLR